MVLGLGFLIGWVVASQQSIAIRQEIDTLRQERDSDDARARLNQIQ